MCHFKFLVEKPQAASDVAFQPFVFLTGNGPSHLAKLQEKLEAIVIANSVEIEIGDDGAADLEGAAELGDAKLDKVVAELGAETVAAEGFFTNLLDKLEVVEEVVLHIELLPLHGYVAALPFAGTHTPKASRS